MELGMIGLGRMGRNMVWRLIGGDHRVVVYDSEVDAVESSAEYGAIRSSSIEDLTDQLGCPRYVWVMGPSGQATEGVITTLKGILSPGDTVIDGGNAYYKHSMRRAVELEKVGISFLDVGTSGGDWGAKYGYSMMVGGALDVFRKLESVFQTLAPSIDKGYGYVGPAGAGHFVKMVHNAIEYGLMQAYAEGLELMEAKNEFGLDLRQIVEIWQHGSVGRSWLLDLTASALKEDPELAELEPYVQDSGEGRWSVKESIDLSVPIPVITAALQTRFRSRQDNPFGARLLSSLRSKFGGHAAKSKHQDTV